MNKSVCFSVGCPFIIKKRNKMTNMPIYLCGVKNMDVNRVRTCERVKN